MADDYEDGDMGGDDYDEGLEMLEDMTDAAAAAASAENEMRLLLQQHPECRVDFIEDVILKLSRQEETVSAGGGGGEIVIDKNHKTYPFLTKYEETQVIGLRASALSNGARPFIRVPPHITKSSDIARLELEKGVLPYIIKRPLPDGTHEYWRLRDLLQMRKVGG